MNNDDLSEAIARGLRAGTPPPPPGTVIICRYCGFQPAWAADWFCGRCQDALHEQVTEFLAQH